MGWVKVWDGNQDIRWVIEGYAGRYGKEKGGADEIHPKRAERERGRPSVADLIPPVIQVYRWSVLPDVVVISV
jgi:hypothetical protein